MKVTFIVPAFNEARTIGRVLELVEALPLDKQVIVVDDGSSDGTGAIAAAHPAVHLVTQQNAGKGAAIRAAIPLIEGEIVVIQDADMEYDPAEVPSLIEPIERGSPTSSTAPGSRVASRNGPTSSGTSSGNRFLSLVTGVLFNTTLSDMETGYKAFRTDVLQSLDLREDDFAIEPEITARICKQKLRIYELPISYYGRTYDEGKKITWRDGFKALWVLVRVRVSAG